MLPVIPHDWRPCRSDLLPCLMQLLCLQAFPNCLKPAPCSELHPCILHALTDDTRLLHAMVTNGYIGRSHTPHQAGSRPMYHATLSMGAELIVCSVYFPSCMRRCKTLSLHTSLLLPRASKAHWLYPLCLSHASNVCLLGISSSTSRVYVRLTLNHRWVVVQHAFPGLCQK